jgi:glycosyltransferase involved in cell wall biosynthesis
VLGGRRPPHVFVTQNGDWPAFAENSEYRLFGCEGLVCTNPDFYARNKQRWRSRLIPNGVDRERFRPGEAQRAALGLPVDKLVVLMVSALIASKRVELGIEAISRMPEAYLLVAGDGPRRELIDRQAGELMPGRFSRLTVPSERMPTLYQAADVFMHLSKDEAFGNVFLEAMACGLPVVAGNSSRVRWIVGEDEFLFDADDPATIAHHVERAGAARSHLRARAQKAEAFSWSKIGQMYHDFLGEVMASEARRSHRSDVPQRGST